MFLFSPATAPYANYFLDPFKIAAPLFRVEPIAAPVHDATELETVVTAQAREPDVGLIVMPDLYFVTHRDNVIALAARYRLPAVYPFRIFSEAGGLLSYGNHTPDNYRRAATYVDRILKGANPGELPVQAPAQFELVIISRPPGQSTLKYPCSSNNEPTKSSNERARVRGFWLSRRSAQLFLGRGPAPAERPS